MTVIHRSSAEHRTTRAAEGLARWRWTTVELVRLAELGAFTAEDRFELIGGEIVPMSPVGRRHEVVSEELHDLLRSRVPSGFRVRHEGQLNLTDDAYTKPDVLVRPQAIRTPDLRGPTVMLVVEVAETSLQFDTTLKAVLYAGHGVREYWVVNARTLATRVHRAPGPDGYADVYEIAQTDLLSSQLVPELSLRLADLDLR